MLGGRLQWSVGGASLVLCCALLAACTGAAELYSGLPEADANDIVALLATQGITADKVPAKQGFTVSVPQGDFGPAIDLLRANGLPRNAYSGMGEVFKKDGMISSPTEEHARYIYALSQELERTLTGIDGIVMARVHPVLPERLAPGEPVQVASCAVLIKYRPGWDSSLYEDRIRRLVISSIPGLTNAPTNNVSVVFVEADPGAQAVPASAPAVTTRSRGTARVVTVLALGVLLAVSALYFAWDWRRERQRAQRSGGRTHRTHKERDARDR